MPKVRWWEGVLLEEGIRRDFSCTYTLEKNGVAKGKNRTIEEAARAILRITASCLSTELFSCLPIEQVPLRLKASPA